MKKRLFATALVASAAAFADPTALNAISFEGYSADATFANGAAEKGEDGNDKTPGPFFYYEGDADGSSVKTFASGDAGAATGVTRPFYFQGVSPALNYLELSTEGGTLWRSINPISATTVGEEMTYGLGTAQAVAADGTYFDALVQFTPTEDGGAPELDAADKLAIWLNVDGNGVTNLMVKAGWVDAMGQPVATNFVLTGTSVVAGEWYRLTVKAVPNIIDTEGMYGSFYNIPAFRIYVDGTEMAATTSPIDATLANLDGTIASGFASLVAANKVFPSIVPPEQGVAYALQGVGFKGSGALDDIVWTTEDPFANSSGGAEWVAAVTNVFVGADLTSAQTALIVSWATAKSITVAAGSEEIAAAAYLLNMTTLPAAIPELTITSIEEGESAWTLTVAASVGDSALALPATINGEVKLTQAATLAGLATATPTTVQMTIANGTGTVTVAKDAATAKFMKVGIGIATPAN